MQTLIFRAPTCPLSPQFSPQFFYFHCPSLYWKNPNFLSSFPGKWRHLSGVSTHCSTTASGPRSYGGWDDPRFLSDSFHSGESNQLRNFLNSLGMDDRKYFFVYLLGFICALAISRIRISSIIVFPACVVVFAAGFSLGFVNGGHRNDLSLNGNKKRPKDENFRASIDKLRNLVDMLNGFGIKIVNLKNDVKRGIECNQMTVGDLESYVKALESIRLSALNARNTIEAFTCSISEENQDVERTLSQKSSRKRNDARETGFDRLQYVIGLFQDKSVASRPNKMKDLVQKDSDVAEVNGHRQGNIFAPNIGAAVSNSVLDVDWGGTEELVDGDRRFKVNANNGNINTAEMYSDTNRIRENEDNNCPTNGLRFKNKQQIFLTLDSRNEVETWKSHDSLLDSFDFSISTKHMETEALFSQEQTFKKLNGYYRHSDITKESENETYVSHIKEEKVSPDDDPALVNNHQSTHGIDFGPPPSSTVSNDIAFNGYLVEANSLLKEARECLRDKVDGRHAENALHKSAILLSRAIDMKPMSLLAVGQLGNTYLLHGELKLKISRELRAVLSRHGPLAADKWRRILKGLNDEVMNRDRIVSLLVNVCEGCEELLVKAGRQYRVALTIDGNDMRALYSWGLALSFRAQLIADIGPETAVDADKVFLAAIDKFNAMMSKSNAHAPDALFRWGAALQQRSRLRRRNIKEKVKLLQQAKRLYEDALQMDSSNLQVRDALSSCISELRRVNY